VKVGNMLVTKRGLARLSFLSAVFAGYLLGFAVLIYAAELQPAIPGAVNTFALEGIWERVDEFHSGGCTTFTLTIKVLEASQELLARLRADESIQCDDGGKYILHYVGVLLQNNGKFFISFNPPPNNSEVKPVEALADSQVNRSYTPDRLTLWLSGDRCALAGSRDDASGPAKGSGLLTVKKRGCS
jgi:hypothetical protein